MVNQKKCSTFALGEMAEWSIAAVLKTVELRGSGGSNPSLSAKRKEYDAPAYYAGVFFIRKIADAVFDRSLHKRWPMKIYFQQPPLSQSYRQKICRPLFSASSSESGIAHLNTGVAEQKYLIFRGAPLRLRRSNPFFSFEASP